MSAFVALCEGFLGIDPHFDLWQHFFTVNPSKKRVGKQELSVPMGYASIHLHNNRVNEYPSMRLSTSNKGWHSLWFYVKDDIATPLPVFSERIIEEVPRPWNWGVLDKDKKKIKDHLTTLQILKERGVKGSGIIGVYHMWRVAPLMSHALPLYLIGSEASLKGTTLVDEALPPPKWRNTSRRRWSLRRTTPALSLISCTQCRGIPPCGQNRGSSTL